VKAIILEKFGGTNRLQLAELPQPEMTDDEVLIEVAYAGVNPVDWKIREGYLKEALPHQLPIIPGWECAGTIKKVGGRVQRFSPGEKVYAYCRKPLVQWGAYCELVAVSEKSIARAPKQMKAEEAAGVPLAALTAFQVLFDVANLKKDETVLIHAGAGGVGSFAIQFAKNAGARVLTTARQINHEYVKQLGADVALDYTARPFPVSLREIEAQGVDVIFDCAGGETLSQSYGCLKAGGRLVTIVDQPTIPADAPQGIKAQYHFVTPSGRQLTEIAALIDAGKIKAPALQILPLADAAKAQELSRAGRTRGKIVLKVKS